LAGEELDFDTSRDRRTELRARTAVRVLLCSAREEKGEEAALLLASGRGVEDCARILP